MSEETSSSLNNNKRKELSEEESWAEHMKTVNSFYKDTWDELSSFEKATCVNYKRQIISGINPGYDLINKFSKICDKHHGFHLGFVP